MTSNKYDDRATIYEYIDQTFHRSVMAIQPHSSSEEHRRRLVRLQSLRQDEMSLLRRCSSADEMASLFILRAESGAWDEPRGDAKFLGVPTLLDSLEALRAKISELGIHIEDGGSTGVAFNRAAKSPIDASKTGSPNGKNKSRAERQNLLLDEGIEETFPASDPVSVAQLR